MGKKEILTYCIDAYEKAMQELPDDRWLEFLEQRNMHFGICWFVKQRFNKKIYSKKWIYEYRVDNENWYWCEIPLKAESKQEAFFYLQFRYGLMKNILQNENK